MNKQMITIIITALISLFIGFMAGGISQTGCCPITGKIVCKERAAACGRLKCDAEKPTAPAASATEAPEATPAAN